MLELLMRDVTHKLLDAWVPEEIDGPMGSKKVVNKKTTHLIERVDVDMVDRILKIQDRRAKYLALDKPKKIEIEHEFDLDEVLKLAMQIEQSGALDAIDAEFTVKEEKESETEGDTDDKA